MGLTTADLASMPFQRLAAMLSEWGDMNAPDDGTREATQEDIERILK